MQMQCRGGTGAREWEEAPRCALDYLDYSVIAAAALQHAANAQPQPCTLLDSRHEKCRLFKTYI
jgi:hypothetical protein